MLRSIIAFLCLMAVAATAAVVQLDASNFDEVVLNTDKHVFVKFYATWCGHCVRLAPIWEELSEKVKDDVVIAELDVDKANAIAHRYRVRGFPTLKIFTKDDKSGSHNYGGARELNSLIAFVNKETN